MRSIRGVSRCSARWTALSRRARASSPPTTNGSTRRRLESRRLDRIHGAVGVIPLPLWIVLFFISVVIFVYMLFFADSGEGAVTQGVLMGSVTSVIVLMLLLLNFLDSPFHSDVGGLRPVAMERTLRIVDEALDAIGTEVRIPCDEEGNPAE